jgi:hypothetical protein
MTLLWIVGSPVSISIGRSIAKHLWEENRGGTPWEEMAPPAIGFVVALLAVMLMEGIVSCLRKRCSRGTKEADESVRVGAV